MAWANEDLARQFSEIALLLRLSGADTFRVRAYERVASALAAAPVDLAELTEEEIARIKGVGQTTAKRIAEYRATGRIGMLEELRAAVPPGFTELVRVPGLGPKTARQLHDELGIDSLDALRAAIDEGRLERLRGLGAKTVASLKEALGRMGAKDDDRTPIWNVLGMSNELVERLSRHPAAVAVEVAGSVRRMRETIGDIDILVASDDPAAVMEAFRAPDLAVKVLGSGDTKTSILTVRGLQADLRVVAPSSWGAALVYFTGSKQHNVRIRERAVRRGLMLNEYGLFDRETDELVAGRTEAEVYEALGLQEVPPTLREDTGEVEAAAEGMLPRVVQVEDLRGDLHGHTDWSGDGKASLVDMLDAAAARGYAYWAITDHAEDLSINGLSRDRVLAQRTEVRALQDRYPTMRLLHGAELNIGIDGGLDYDLEFLLGYDFTVASVHSLFSRPRDEQTRRITTAIAHPNVDVIGHPTGRKIGRRPGYEIDLDTVADAAVEHGVALEVNASPARLDLSGDMARRAIGRGARVAISCDAHSIGDLRSMRYGVATAQRGWARADDVVNCLELEPFLAWLTRRRPDRADRW